MDPFGDKQKIINDINTKIERIPLWQLERLNKYMSKPNRFNGSKGGRFYEEGSGDHTWPNLANLKEGQAVCCKKCGLKGAVKTVKAFHAPTGVMVELEEPCNTSLKHAALQPQYIRITSAMPPEFGVPQRALGVYKTVKCPPQYMDRFIDKAWIQEDGMREPIRVLDNEYEIPSEELIHYLKSIGEIQ